MKLFLQLFGGRGAGSGRFSYHLPRNPGRYKKYRDITHPKKKEKTRYREYKDEDTGLTVEYHPGKSGERGWQGKDHFHVRNPNSTGNHDYYLNKFGDPCGKGSHSSHLLPGDYELLLRGLL